MDSELLKKNTHAALTGLLMVLSVSQILIQSAYLKGPGSIPWIWAFGFALIILMALFVNRGEIPLETQLAGTGIVILAMGASLAPLVVEAFALPPGTRVDSVIAAIGQLTGYLSGALPDLPDRLQAVGMHWICGVSVLLFLWFKRWDHQSAVMGMILVFGCFRWIQYVSEMESLLLNLALVWSYCAAMSAVPVRSSPGGCSGYQGRFYLSLLLAGGILSGSFILESLFPLDSLNRWMGSWLPIQELYRNEYTQYGLVGFQLENTPWYPLGNRLGGPVTLTKKPVMEVKSSRPGLHLRGMVKTIYTGQAWQAGVATLKPFAEPQKVQGTNPFVLTIHTFNKRDRTLYAPLNTDRIISEGREILQGDESLYRFGFQWFPEENSSYKVEGFLNVPDKASHKPMDPYLQLPEISNELREFTRGIIGSESADAQKMDRLLNWLRAEGTYRLDVKAPDPTKEFVEQFVLGSREGYCTYFATALAVMGRAAGVPTRYVEGYLLPEQTTGKQTYMVTADRAHAWVEAYIAGRGWVVYEPTPVYGLENDPSAVALQSPEAQGSETEEPSGSSPERPANAPPSFSGKLPLAGIWVVLASLILMGLRIIWVENTWRRGLVGPRADLWRLYGILSTLQLIAPDIKTISMPVEQLKEANSIFASRAFDSHDIIGDANRLLYGNASGESEGFKELLTELWQTCRNRKGTAAYLVARYGSLTLFNSYYPLVRDRKFRKEVPHGADQPHATSQS